MEHIASIILAGGKGERMNSDLPKVLHRLNDRPLVLHVIDSLQKAGVDDIIVVVGYKGEMVMEAVSGMARTVWQRQQLGTGHAVMQAKNEFTGTSRGVIVACGDVPLIRPETFFSLINTFNDEHVKAVVLTMDLDDPSGYGRIIKDSSGDFLNIVEHKDADDEQKRVTEVNTGTYIFDSGFLFEGLKRINTDNAQGEYYLPDALNYILDCGFKVRTMLLEDPVEGSGINTKQDLEKLTSLVVQ